MVSVTIDMGAITNRIRTGYYGKLFELRESLSCGDADESRMEIA